jgi:hypothetical protein
VDCESRGLEYMQAVTELKKYHGDKGRTYEVIS